jgi:hypothetical protein
MELSEKKKALMAKILGGSAPEIPLLYMKRYCEREACLPAGRGLGAGTSKLIVA